MISVIIPAYNRAGLIGDTLESIAAQSFRPIEVVVVDDGSSDGTANVVREWAAARSEEAELEVRVIEQPNGGVATARNTGFEHSRGEFVQFCDSDDLLHPDKLTRQSRCLIHDPEVGYVLSSWRHFTDASGIQWEKDIPDPKPLDARELVCSWRVLPGLGLYRRTLLERVGPWNSSMPVGEDIEHGTRMMLLLPKVMAIDSQFMAVRQGHAGRITGALRQTRIEPNVRDRFYRIAEPVIKSNLRRDPVVQRQLAQVLNSGIIQLLGAGEAAASRKLSSVMLRYCTSPKRRCQAVSTWILSLFPRALARTAISRLMNRRQQQAGEKKRAWNQTS